MMVSKNRCHVNKSEYVIMSDTNPPANVGNCDKSCIMFVSFGHGTIAGLKIINK